MSERYLVVTDRGCYSEYGFFWYYCDAMTAHQLAALSKDLDTIFREKRFRRPNGSGWTTDEHYLFYEFESVRLIQRVDDDAIYGGDGREEPDGIAELIKRYAQHVRDSAPRTDLAETQKVRAMPFSPWRYTTLDGKIITQRKSESVEAFHRRCAWHDKRSGKRGVA